MKTVVSFAGSARSFALLLALSAATITAQAQPTETTKTVSRWEAAISKFETRDQQTSPPQNGILFVGSSSIVGWDVEKSFPGKPVINRGFGGSQVSDVLEYFDRVVVPYKPQIVVLYSGDNDINGGKSPETVAANIKEFVRLVDEKVPSARRIIIIPPKPSISRYKQWPKMQRVAELVREMAAQHKHVVVVDMSYDMMAPKPELFKKDNLHMSQEGYDIWNKNLEPHLKTD